MNSKDVGMFMKFPVRNWTFDGIFEELMDFAQNQNMMELPIPYDRFGWFYPVSTYDFFWFDFLKIHFVNFSITREMIVLNTTEHFPCIQEKVIFKTSDKSQSGIFYPTSTKVFTPSLAAT